MTPAVVTRVVVFLDSSPRAPQLARRAIALARRAGSPLVVLWGVRRPPSAVCSLRGPGLSSGRDVRTPLSLHALPRAQLNLAGALGSFGQGPSVSRVDFGVAEAGKTERVFVQSRTNAPARIRITSANKGVLRSEDDPDPGAGVRYSAVLDNRPLDLSQPAAIDVDPPRTFQGESLELVLTLGPVPPLRAGAYSDALTFEISTL